MDEDSLIDAVRKRAADPTTRTDRSDSEVPELAIGATPEQVERGEAALGVALFPLHRRLLREVGNGGFGPGDGLIGLPGGRVDDDGRSVVELRQQLLINDDGCSVPTGIVPLCDWGDGAWSCIDAATGTVLMLDEAGLVDTGMSLHEWMTDWVSGVELVEKLFDFSDGSGINPFTKQRMKFRVRGRPRGIPIAPVR